MIKRIIVAALPILLAAQIPFSMTKYVPSDWKKNFHYGVKWTGLLLDSFSIVANNESDTDPVPSGFVTVKVQIKTKTIQL